MKAEILGLEPIRRLAPAPGSRAFQSDLHGNVENDGQVRLQIADRDALHGVEKAGRDIAEPALIGPRGIEETVAQYPGALAQRRENDRAHMIVAGGGK